LIFRVKLRKNLILKPRLTELHRKWSLVHSLAFILTSESLVKRYYCHTVVHLYIIWRIHPGTDHKLG